MKLQWDNLSKAIGEAQNIMSEFFEGITEKKYDKAIKAVSDKWNRVIILHNEFDKLIEPVKPLNIKLPFESPEFTELWSFYKDYLTESHQMYLGSRHEVMTLRRLAKLANKNEQQAIEMLEFFMANGYKSIFKPTDKQVLGEEPAKTEEPEKQTFNSQAKKVDL